MSWMGWVAIGIIAANVIFFGVLYILSEYEDYQKRGGGRHGNRPADR